MMRRFINQAASEPTAHRRHFLQSLLAASAAWAVADRSGVAIGKPPGSEPTVSAVTAATASRTTFQTGAEWSGRINLNTDSVMVYGINNLRSRLVDWAKHGYQTDAMTGVAWGTCADFIDGKWNGVRHGDDVQRNAQNQPYEHGGVTGGYLCPTESYDLFFTQVVKKMAHAGARAIYLEEPEFWAGAGWEKGFRRQWKNYYHENWIAPDSSVDAQWRASKLKYFLFRRLLKTVGSALRGYGARHGRNNPFYVATHSLLNYASWRIVSPESSLIEVPCDGYIAQVWTGTARVPNVYRGLLLSRPFETAFLEFGVFRNFIRGPGRNRLMWFLADPASDNPHHTWEDYRTHWQDVLTASLFYPEVARYEVMPWPERVFQGTRHIVSNKLLKKANASDVHSTDPQHIGSQFFKSHAVGIPADYATELQSAMAALPGMHQPPDAIRWLARGTTGIGVLVSDTMLFQRAAPTPSDPYLGAFYGLAMPLLKRGMPVESVQIEYAASHGFLDRYRILILTYEGQKPPVSEFHTTLTAWVKRGGVLVVMDNDNDPYNAVHEWWNTAPMRYATPRDHLFELLDVPVSKSGASVVGNGFVIYQPLSPAALSYQKNGDEAVCDQMRLACKLALLPWKESSSLVLRRGPYIITSGLTELKPGTRPTTLHGRFIPLFNARLPLVTSYTVAPGTRNVLVDLDSLPQGSEGVVAAACRIDGQKVTSSHITFLADGIEDTQAVVCVTMVRVPRAVWVAGKPLPAAAWDYADGLLRICFANSVTALTVDIHRS